MKIVLEMCRCNPKVFDSDYFNDINWSKLYQYLISNKVLTFFWKNLNYKYPDAYMPKYINNIGRFSYVGTRNQNTLYFNELNMILEQAKLNNIHCYPVKGAMLIPSLYNDFGIRSMNDIDFLIKHDDIEKIDYFMCSLGYIQGRYRQGKNEIIPYERNKKINWKLHMSNLLPYVKKVDSEYLSVIKCDFRYALDDNLNKESINEIVDTAINEGSLKKSHILTHLCTHLYDESKQSMNVCVGKDINLIKYIDIREYILQAMSNSDLIETVDFCKKYNLTKQLYFALYFLKLIYNDGYEEKLMVMLGICDTMFLNTYGDKSTENNFVWKKTFFERMFSGDNSDELSETPKYYLE